MSVKELAREADLWRELAEINGRRVAFARSGQVSKRLDARYNLVTERLRRLGVSAGSPPAGERFAERMLLTFEEARAVRAAILGDAFDSRTIDLALGRIALELEAHVPNDDEPPTARST
jgi:hypothetical protein